jgi:hypothetical protein
MEIMDKFDTCEDFVPQIKIYSSVKEIRGIASREAHLAPLNIPFK